MNAITGAGTLTRLALRLDRVRLLVWVLTIGILPMGTAAQYRTLYPDDSTIRQVAGVITNPSLEAVNGPLYSPTLGGLTTWKILATELILVALMSLLTTVRHTRAEEEAGRLELVGAAAVGRHAPLTAALVTAGLADLGAGLLVALGLVATGLGGAGAATMGLAITLTGLVFTALGAVAAQLTTSARSATGIAAAVLGAAYLLRAVGDTGVSWLGAVSPLHWAIRSRPFAGDRWAALLPAVLVAALLVIVAYALVARRDLGAGLLPARPGPPVGAPGLRSPLALAWRLHRATLLGWVVAMALSGATLAGVADSLDDTIGANSQLAELLTRMGGNTGIVDAYLAAVLGIMGLVVSAYTIQAVSRMRAEETGGRLEPLLATEVTRNRWVCGHLAFAVLGTALLLAVAGASAGLAYGVQVHDVGAQVPRLLGATLAQLPATAIMAGIGVALFGLAPRWTPLAWAALIACVALLEVGTLLGLSQRLVDFSPFAHVPKLPGAAFTATPLLWLTAVAVLLTATGLTAFRRRDIG